MPHQFNPDTDELLKDAKNARLVNTVRADNFTARLEDADNTTALQPWALDGSVPVAADTTLKSHVAVDSIGGKFTNSANKKLTVKGQIKAGRVPLFTYADGFRSDNLFITSGTNTFYPEWFGAVGDGVTDDSDAFQLMFDTVKIGSGITTGGRCVLSSGKSYLWNKRVVINKPLRFVAEDGAGSASAFGTAKIISAPNTGGLVTDSGFIERNIKGAAMNAGIIF